VSAQDQGSCRDQSPSDGGVREPASGWVADAILKNWWVQPWGEGRIVHGEIYADSKGRFRDGESVRTSFVLTLEGDQLTTRNTRYRLTDPLSFTSVLGEATASPAERSDLARDEHKGEGQ
jgi:hypothetical protein